MPVGMSSSVWAMVIPYLVPFWVLTASWYAAWWDGKANPPTLLVLVTYWEGFCTYSWWVVRKLNQKNHLINIPGIYCIALSYQWLKPIWHKKLRADTQMRIVEIKLASKNKVKIVSQSAFNCRAIWIQVDCSCRYIEDNVGVKHEAFEFGMPLSLIVDHIGSLEALAHGLGFLQSEADYNWS